MRSQRSTLVCGLLARGLGLTERHADTKCHQLLLLIVPTDEQKSAQKLN